MRLAPVTNREKRNLVPARIKDAQRIPLVLLPVLQPFHQAIAVIGLHSHPLLLCGIRGRKSGRQIRVAIVAGESEEPAQLRARIICGRQVQRMIALQHIESAAVCRHAAQHAGDVDIRVGVAVAMRVGGKVVGHQIAAHRDVLRNRFAVVAGHAGHKILRRLDAAGCGLDRQPGNRNRRAGPSGIGVQQFLAHHHFF